MDYASLSPEQQAQVVKLAMAGKAQSPGNMSRAKQLLGTEPGFAKAMMQRAGLGGRETQVGPATIDHFKGMMDEEGPATAPQAAAPATKSGGGGGKSSASGGGNGGSTVVADTSGKPSPNEPFRGKNPSAESKVAAGGDDGSPEALDAQASDTMDMLAALAAGAVTAGVIGGTLWYLNSRDGKPIRPINEFEQGAIKEIQGGPQRGVPSLANPTEGKIMSMVDMNDAPDAYFNAKYVGPQMLEGSPAAGPAGPAPAQEMEDIAPVAKEGEILPGPSNSTPRVTRVDPMEGYVNPDDTNVPRAGSGQVMTGGDYEVEGPLRDMMQRLQIKKMGRMGR